MKDSGVDMLWRGYFRFGAPPPDERSEVFGVALGAGALSGFFYQLYQPQAPKEAGVSVFEATLQENTLVVNTGGDSNGDLRLLFGDFVRRQATREQRPVYLVSGDVVGRGLAGEPVLRNCTLWEVPLTVAIVPDSCGGDGNLAQDVENWNLWRYLDGTREGYRTPPSSDNMIEAYSPPAIRRTLHWINELRWQRRRPATISPTAVQRAKGA